MPKTALLHFHIPTREIKITFARSGGAGGQNVNKTSTKAILHWSVGQSRVLNAEQKERIRAKLANKINWFDEVVIMAEEERSQLQNRAAAVARLQTLVAHALRVPKKRRPTRPTYGSKLRRLESKKNSFATKNCAPRSGIICIIYIYWNASIKHSTPASR